jgi:hypothetical protein
MTLQYDQGNINLLDASPINVDTSSAATVNFVMDSLTDDEQFLGVVVYGNGGDPADASNRYAVNPVAVATFVRTAGAGAVTTPGITLSSAGTVPTLSFQVDDATTPGSTLCILRIVPGAATAYVNRLKVSKIRF